MNRYRLILHFALAVALLISGSAAMAHVSGEHPADAAGSVCAHGTRQTAGSDALPEAPADPDSADSRTGHGLDHIGCGGTAHLLPSSVLAVALARSLPSLRPHAESLTSRIVSPDPYPSRAHRLH